MVAKIEFHKVGMTPKQADEAMSGIRGATETLWQLEALFKAILQDSNTSTNNIEQLAKLGAYVSCDIANLTDCMVESLELGEVK